jgi:DNA polymerase zeta
MIEDPRAEPRYSERVRYVVVTGNPDARLTDLVVSPEDFLTSRFVVPYRSLI